MYPLLGIIFSNVRAFLSATCVVDQNFKSPQLLADLLNRCFDLLEFRNVAGERDTTTPCLANFFCCVVDFCGSSCQDRNVGTGLCVGDCNRSSDSAAGPSYQCALS